MKTVKLLGLFLVFGLMLTNVKAEVRQSSILLSNNKTGIFKIDSVNLLKFPALVADLFNLDHRPVNDKMEVRVITLKTSNLASEQYFYFIASYSPHNQNDKSRLYVSSLLYANADTYSKLQQHKEKAQTYFCTAIPRLYDDECEESRAVLDSRGNKIDEQRAETKKARENVIRDYENQKGWVVRHVPMSASNYGASD